MPGASFISRLPRDPLRLSLALLVFLTIGRAHMHFGFGFLRPGLTLVGFAGAYAVLNPKSVSDRFLSTWQGWLVPAIALIALASLPFGIAPGGSARYFLDDFSKVLITAGVLLMATRGVYESLLWTVAYVAGCAMLVWYAIFVFDLSTEGSLAARLNDLYTYDANDVGLLLVVGIPLCMWVFDSSRGILKVIVAGILGGSVWAIALTGSRGAFVSLLVVGFSILVIALGRVSVPKRVLIVGGLTGVLVLAAPPGYWDQMRTLLSAEEDYNWTSDTGRKAIALRGLDYMLEYPVFGVGLDNFSRAEGTLSSMAVNAMPGRGVPWTAPHNSYVQVGAELGVPGALVFGALVFGGLGAMYLLSRRASRRWRHEVDDPRRQVVLASRYLTLSYVGFAIGASFLSFAYLDLIYLLTAMAVGVHLEERRLLAEDAATVVVPGRGRITGERGGLALADTRRSVEVEPPDDVMTPDR